MDEQEAQETADAILDRAGKPASASGDGQSASAHPIQDQIEAAKFAAANANGGKPRVRLTRIVPPGA